MVESSVVQLFQWLDLGSEDGLYLFMLLSNDKVYQFKNKYKT